MPYGELELELDFTRDKDDDFDDLPIQPPGQYHLQVVGASIEDKPSRNLCLRCRVLAGPPGSTAGATVMEKFYLSAEAQKRLRILAVRMGLADRGDCGARKVVDWSHIVGRDLVAEVIVEDYTNKRGQPARVNKWAGFSGFWAADDPRVADVPKGQPAGVVPCPAPANGAPAAATSLRQQSLPLPSPSAYDDI